MMAALFPVVTPSPIIQQSNPNIYNPTPRDVAVVESVNYVPGVPYTPAGGFFPSVPLPPIIRSTLPGIITDYEHSPEARYAPIVRISPASIEGFNRLTRR